MWEMLRVYGVEEKLLKAVQSFFAGEGVCPGMNGHKGVIFGECWIETGLCDVPMVV